MNTDPSRWLAEIPPPGRLFRVAQFVVIAASGGLAVAAAYRILDAPPIWNDQPRAWAKVVAAAGVLMAIIAIRWPRHAAAATALGCMIIAAALLTPGPVVSVALLLGAAMLAGHAVIEGKDGPTSLSTPIAVLIGVSLWIGLFALTARLRIHYPHIHAAIALLAFVVWRHRARNLVVQAWQWATAPRTATATERAWIAIAGLVAVVHIVVAALPEVGYDASAVHLQFAQLVAADHRFRYGIDRYLWALMPLGADYAFATAYSLGGEAAARTLNLAFGALACALVYRLGRYGATREAALVCATLFAAMPLAMLVTGSLFSEALCVALLLAVLAVLVDGWQRHAPFLPAFAILAGGAMATKVLSAVWLAVLVPAAVWIAYRDRSLTPFRKRDALLIGIGLVIGAWHYVAAWAKTGNPVFPFMNGLFRSPHYDTESSFKNPAFDEPLHPWTPWRMVLESGAFLEGRDGALGLAWLFALPLVALLFLRRPPAGFRLMAVLAIVFFVAVYLQQAYLRYLLPSFALVAVLASGALADLVRTPVARAALLAVGVASVAFDVRAIASAHYPLATPCIACIYDARERARYVETYAPLRTVSARLNRELPDARVGFLLPNEAAPAGYVGNSRSGNWHDDAFFRGLVRAETPEAIERLAQRHRLTHVVYRVTPNPPWPTISAFATQRTKPLWRVADYVVAVIEPAPRE